MHLNNKSLQDTAAWVNEGFILPKFDRQAVTAATKAAPVWIHFGAGNIFRAFPALAMQKLLDNGITDKGIVVAEGYDYEIIDKIFTPHDNLTLLATLKADGTIEKTVVASVVEALRANSGNSEDWQRLVDIFSNPSLQFASFTITEKGYAVSDASGNVPKDIAQDFAAGPSAAISYMGKVAALLYKRYMLGAYPLAMVSMDNCSHNGTRLHAAVSAFATEWVKNGFADKGFCDYINGPSRVAFPWSMIDKITPRPDESVAKMLNSCGFGDTGVVTTSKNTYVAPFVNAEQAEYLVIEDAFPNGRPALEKAGILFTQRETVDKVEKMKVCTCLNPLHTALAVFGCLLGYTKISDEMNDKELVKLVEKVGYQEGLPVVVDPGIIDPKAFIDEVLGVRVPNPFMPDTPQRIACDTSQKVPIRFGETIKAYIKRDDLDAASLRAIPLVLAGWCRYLTAIDDEGNVFTLSPDPMLDMLQDALSGITLGSAPELCKQKLNPVLSNPVFFGVNLYEAGLGEVVESMFCEMIAAPGAIRKTLQKHLS